MSGGSAGSWDGSVREEVRWADIALACGYYDQAHFIRDFQAFSGINPSQYLARRGAWASHVRDS